MKSSRPNVAPRGALSSPTEVAGREAPAGPCRVSGFPDGKPQDVGAGTTLVATLVLIGTAGALIALPTGVLTILAVCAIAIVGVTALGMALRTPTPTPRGRTHSGAGRDQRSGS